MPDSFYLSIDVPSSIWINYLAISDDPSKKSNLSGFYAPPLTISNPDYSSLPINYQVPYDCVTYSSSTSINYTADSGSVEFSNTNQISTTNYDYASPISISVSKLQYYNYLGNLTYLTFTMNNIILTPTEISGIPYFVASSSNPTTGFFTTTTYSGTTTTNCSVSLNKAATNNTYEYINLAEISNPTNSQSYTSGQSFNFVFTITPITTGNDTSG